MTEDEVVGWHHRLNGYEFDQTLRDNKDREAWPREVAEVGHDLATEDQQMYM